MTQRTQIREVNTDRVYNICREAAEQSNRLSVPAVGDPVSLDDFVDVFPDDRALIVCAEWGEATALHDALHSPALKKFSKAAIVTGPEGGFAAGRAGDFAQASHMRFLSAGPAHFTRGYGGDCGAGLLAGGSGRLENQSLSVSKRGFGAVGIATFGFMES